MARDNQSLVTLTPSNSNQIFSWTSAATSTGTKKIRRMVNAFGIFIAQTNYIKSVTAASPLWGSQSWLQPAFSRRVRASLGWQAEACPTHAGLAAWEDLRMARREPPARRVQASLP